VNSAAFYKFDFFVDKSVLIPRPDSETVVNAAISFLNKRHSITGGRDRVILDLGTGSGCLLLSIVSENDRYFGIGVDLSDSALKIALRNAEILNLYRSPSVEHEPNDFKERFSFSSQNRVHFLKRFAN
jgi:release factor glutamine methyltransferase